MIFEYLHLFLWLWSFCDIVGNFIAGILMALAFRKKTTTANNNNSSANVTITNFRADHARTDHDNPSNPTDGTSERATKAKTTITTATEWSLLKHHRYVHWSLPVKNSSIFEKWIQKILSIQWAELILEAHFWIRFS